MLLQQMVESLDAYSNQQSRLIVIVDGLDSVEQRKILTVLDTVHGLFSDPGQPFIILLAIDPHVIIKAIELNLNQVFSDTSIGGHAYLRNMVHLPFFLQNAGLRKVKVAQQLSSKQKMAHSWMETEEKETRDTRRFSIESDDVQVPVSRTMSKLKLNRKKKTSYTESVDNSIASNLNKLGQSPLELNKMFLTDDYFSDVNPRSMRRLMNVIYVMGRLLKAFSIEFSWHHLSSWANITEQWPYRTSWITLYAETCEDKLDDSVSLKQVYDKVKPVIPTQKELEPLLEMDRDEKKLDVFLAYHKKTLTVANLKIFLPFTINLDPFIKKVIKEEVQNLEELGHTVLASPENQVTASKLTGQLSGQPPPLTRRQAVGLSKKLVGQESVTYPQIPGGFMTNYMNMSGLGLPFSPYPQQHNLPYQNMQQSYQNMYTAPSRSKPSLPTELKRKHLSTFSVDQVCILLRSIELMNPVMLDTYCSTVVGNNVSGRVLLHCQLDELRNVLNMNFGDWELLKIVLLALREDEINGRTDSPVSEKGGQVEDGSGGHEIRRADSAYKKKQTLIERQVAMEEATVSGLLSTLNEDAQEDILIEAINNARDEDGTSVRESEEADVIYYSTPSNYNSIPNIDVVSEADVEKGKKVRRDEIIWSARSSRNNSISRDLDNAGLNLTTTSPVPGSVGLHHLTSIDEENKKSTIKKKSMVDRAKTVLAISRNTESVEEDPYAWLSKTAPPSPGSVRRTKKKDQEKEPEERDESRDRLSRVNSRDQMNRVKRRIQNVLTHSEPGSFPMVQKARPNQDEYDEISKSSNVSRSPSPPISGASTRAGSACSDDSMSSPEQRTVFKRPGGQEDARPPLLNVFSQDDNASLTIELLPQEKKEK